MPAISTEALVERLVAGKPVPAVLLSGPDSYLRETCRDQIVNVVVEPSVRDWALARFSADEDDLSIALGLARTVPMLARRQVVVITSLEAVEEQAEKKRDAQVDDLTAYLDDPAPFTVLVLEATKLDQRMKLGKLLAAKAMVVAAELPENGEARLRMAGSLAVQMARERKAPLDKDTAEVLADLCNANLAAIRMEIEKLATYVGPGQPIRRADVDALVVSEKKYSVWELSEMLATRQRAKALVFLDSLLREGEQPPALVGAMAWMYRTLLAVQELGPHVSGAQASGLLRMRRDTAEMAVLHARKIPRRQLLDGLRLLYDADSRLKSGAKDPRAVMEFLVAQLIGAKPAQAAPAAERASANFHK
jgi:DNA polymerase III subunit delta